MIRTEENTFTKKVRSNCWGIIKCHLLEPKTEHKENSRSQVRRYHEEVEGQKCESQHHRIILEMTRVDKDKSRLQKHAEKCHMLRQLRGQQVVISKES